eukprot:gb/GECG01004067.1/.p1 GENE.gb/GECG01004067.1/~~gb/GECG01004067.1/.p1  ORF type:complete len:262 (+),score=24.10 gb/GECG01004067.1/:1-786(+)
MYHRVSVSTIRRTSCRLTVSCSCRPCAYTTPPKRTMASQSKEEPRKIKVYTRTGDKGTSMLFNGERRDKNDPLFMALGDVDELNAYVGLALEHCKLSEGDAFQSLVGQLSIIQSRLLDAGSAIATPLSSSGETQTSRVAFEEAHVDTLEQWIDQMEDQLPTLRNFILPSGGLASSHLHVARTLCRRAERRVTDLVHSGDVPTAVSRYLNRLSDYFFVAARFAAHENGTPEQVYQKGTGLASSSSEMRSKRTTGDNSTADAE